MDLNVQIVSKCRLEESPMLWSLNDKERGRESRGREEDSRFSPQTTFPVRTLDRTCWTLSSWFHQIRRFGNHFTQ